MNSPQEAALKEVISKSKCGICGEKAELGPYCGGPYAFYCKGCHDKFMKIIGDYLHHLERTGFAIYHKRKRKIELPKELERKYE